VSELITNIGELTSNTDEVGRRTDAAIVIEDGRVVWIGSQADAPQCDRRVDAGGRALLPGWIDSHTHLLFAGDRTGEFEARMAGKPYTAGGIEVTVAETRRASTEQIISNARRLRQEAEAQGTTFLEVKTGYGLTITDEVRLAEAGSAVADRVTFLGAHVVAPGIDRDSYLSEVCGPMLDAVAQHVQAIDVFCEEGAFSVDEARAVLSAGHRAGLQLRVHGNQLGRSGGVQLAVEMHAASVDHCNHLDEDDISALASSTTVATVLPACDLSTRQPLAPARALVDAGATVAIASNCNPGSSYTTSIPYCVATAVLQMGLTIEEAVWAATRGGALALGLDGSNAPDGMIRIGARADLQLLNAPSIAHLAYRPGVPITSAVWVRGEQIV
jgi:imidazolonepropionase